jgi:riboflavin biosynthesis pyrimidine reductase
MPSDVPLINEPGEILWIVGEGVDATQPAPNVLIFKSAQIKSKIDLTAIVDELGSRGLHNVMIEAGAELAGAFVENGLVDKVAMFIAPKIIGGTEAPGPLAGLGISAISDALVLENITHTVIDGDILIEGFVSKSN